MADFKGDGKADVRKVLLTGEVPDQASKDRLSALRGDLANFAQQSAELTTRWQNERDKIAAEGKVKEQLDAARIELEQAQRAGDYAKAGELTYSRIPELERRMADDLAAIATLDAA